MKYLDLTLPTPAENLALDEALLDWCEETDADEILRFWKPHQHFVVVGYSNRVQQEVNVEACRALAVPILRRCSGGGAVLQGPGCANYALVIRTQPSSPSESISGANAFIMERHRAALSSLLGKTVEVQGHTDLTIDGLKCSGNSQRRKSRHLLFHGTFLLQLDLGLVERTLRHPSRQPAYRQNRAHGEFMTHLPLTVIQVSECLRKCWGAKHRSEPEFRERVARLVSERYANEQWIFKQ